MKIAVSASEPELNSPVDPRFGRSPYYIFLDPSTMDFEAIKNPNLSSPSGAGIQAAQFVANRGVQALLTGSCGPNAFQTLEAGGVEVFIGVTGTVKEAAQKYVEGKLRTASEPNVPAHHGMGIGNSLPSEPGFGPGSGGGTGGELGIEQLKKRAEFLKQQLEDIAQRIDELAKTKT